MSEDNPLTQNIIKQVEYYFSPQNLQSDNYLRSKMDPQLFVPLEVVAGFKMLRNITTDVDLIKQSLKRSTKVELMESATGCFIRPVITSNTSRTTLILREIPKDTSTEELKQLFPQPDKIYSVRPDIADTWFVSFNSEEDCKEAYDAVQERTIKGHPVKARIKSENFIKNLPQSFAPSSKEDLKPPVMLPPFPPFVPPTLPYPYLMSAGLIPFPPPPPPPMMQFNLAPEVAVQAPMHGYSDGPALHQGGRGGRGYRGRGGRQHRNQGSMQESGEGFEKNHKSPKRAAAPRQSSTVPKMGLQDFPPLPSSSQASSGYEQTFKRYSKAEIISVLSSLQQQDIPVPPDMPKDCVLVSEEMIRDLELLRAGEEEESTAADNCSKKSFAEVAITSRDIKPPEKAIRRSVAKKGPNSTPPHQGGYNSKKKKNRGVGAGAVAVDSPQNGSGSGDTSSSSGVATSTTTAAE